MFSCTLITAPNMDDVYATIEDVVDDMGMMLIHYHVVDAPELSGSDRRQRSYSSVGRAGDGPVYEHRPIGAGA